MTTLAATLTAVAFHPTRTRLREQAPALRSSGSSWSQGGCSVRSLAATGQLPRHSGSRCLRIESAVKSKGLREVDINTYDDALAAAGNKLVVLDMYTQWCGPCKLIAPKLESLSEKYKDVVFLKLDCNQDNKPLAKALGIKVVPTFKLIRNKEVVKSIEGAKYDDLLAEIVKLAGTPQVYTPMEDVAPFLVEGAVVEIGKDTFYPALQQAGGKLVVLDMFTDWCGPCKLLAPKLAEMASQNKDVVFLKLNCNDENKPLAKALGVASVPTVKLFKQKEFVDEVRGNKWDLIVEKITKNR